MLELEMAAWDSLAAELGPAFDIERFVDTLGRLVRRLTGEGRVVTQARLAVFVEAGVNAALQQRINEAQQRLLAWGEPVAAALGLRERRSLLTLLAVVEGLMVNQVANPDPEFDPESAIAAVLRGLA
ncbi:hypothetical protein [Saccharomonospora sp. CUA-673]|uniref:hypothetical protein n=1 Tax=Saccharomonospora sp. CUA-673 TaxID=1904969 RepID=UPI002100687D|nr:hypothetical protein [Saccharomonospora sp. CUA-673]